MPMRWLMHDCVELSSHEIRRTSSRFVIHPQPRRFRREKRVMTATQNRLWLHATAIEAYSHTGYFIMSCNSAKHSESLIPGKSHDIRFSIAERRKRLI